MTDRTDGDEVLQSLAEEGAHGLEPQASWEALQPRLDAIDLPILVTRVSGARWAAGGAMAAILILAVGLVIGWPGGGGRAVAVQAYATRAGQRMTVRLADGTRVTLAPMSRLQLPDHGDRAVTLQGEAYFAVVHDARHPFTVLAHNLQINDVGTEFDVRDYDDDIRVAVARGSVVVGAGRRPGGRSPAGLTRPSPPQNTRTVFQEIPLSAPPPNTRTVFHEIPLSAPPPNTPTVFQDISLSAGDIAEIADGIPTVTHHADIALVTSWMQGRLIFDGMRLDQAVREVGRVFGVRITVSDSLLAAQHVTGTFDDATVDGVLSAMTGVVGARYERAGDAIVIRRRVTGTMQEHGDTHAPLTTVSTDLPGQ